MTVSDPATRACATLATAVVPKLRVTVTATFEVPGPGPRPQPASATAQRVALASHARPGRTAASGHDDGHRGGADIALAGGAEHERPASVGDDRGHAARVGLGVDPASGDERTGEGLRP